MVVHLFSRKNLVRGRGKMLFHEGLVSVGFHSDPMKDVFCPSIRTLNFSFSVFSNFSSSKTVCIFLLISSYFVYYFLFSKVL